MLIFERAKEIPLFNFNFVVEKFTAVRYNKYKGSSRKLFGKLEVSLGIYMIAFKYGLAKKWFGNPQLTYCKVLFGGM